MLDRTHHQEAVRAFLNQEFSAQDWDLSLPHGWGNETYYAESPRRSLFVKLGAPVANYLAMAALSLTPAVLTSGKLQDGTSILVQPRLAGRCPSWADFRVYLKQIAEVVRSMQRSPQISCVLPKATAEQHRALGLKALSRLRQKWDHHKACVPAVAGWVDDNLDRLAHEISHLEGSGVVVAHNDICNANWLITEKAEIYLLDLDEMSMDDPAHDLGALLWWYYPAELREQFLKITGFEHEEELSKRMRLRMALHCLHILLPRENSFDRFDANHFINSLVDFKAILAGEENPQGYHDGRSD